MRNHLKKLQILLFLAFCFYGVTNSPLAFGKKTNQAVYEDPFDQAAGGAALTRASQAAVMFANPALMVYGKKFFRWVGLQVALFYAPDSAETAQNLATGQDNESESETGLQEGFVEEVFTTPIHFGASTALSFITENFTFGGFSRFNADIKGQKHNETGIPELRARGEVYYGGAASFATEIFSWWSLGVTGKYMFKSEPDIIVDIADQDTVSELQENPQALQDEVALGQGIGYDVGTLFFFQSKYFDLRLAGKVDDVGNTSFSENQEAFQQTIHGGIGITLHNTIDAIHLSVDYRDITGVYEEDLPMRIYAGAKLMIRNMFGFAVGLYQGYPTYGIRYDLIIIRGGFTVYSREMGSYTGEDGRNLYVSYFSIGI